MNKKDPQSEKVKVPVTVGVAFEDLDFIVKSFEWAGRDCMVVPCLFSDN